MKAQKKNNLLRNQKGFTLIEIIAVLIILGILAAVAIPKYMSLQDDAHTAATAGALASASSNLNLAYAKCLAGDTAPTGTIAASVWGGGCSVAINTAIGDFTASYAGALTAVTITVTAGPDWFASYSGTKTKTVVLQ